MTQVSALWRHTIKGHGREALTDVTLAAGQAMPWDRRWAVAHELARLTEGEWAPCTNFSIGAKAPALMAINARVDETAGLVTLSHPDRPDLTFDTDRDAQALHDRVRPLMPVNRAQTVRLFRLDGLEPWAEFGLVGRTLRIGEAELQVREPIRRCMATTANPATGARDLDTLAALDTNWNHQDFGIYAEVTRTGAIAVGDRIEVL